MKDDIEQAMFMPAVLPPDYSEDLRCPLTIAQEEILLEIKEEVEIMVTSAKHPSIARIYKNIIDLIDRKLEKY